MTDNEAIQQLKNIKHRINLNITDFNIFENDIEALDIALDKLIFFRDALYKKRGYLIESSAYYVDNKGMEGEVFCSCCGYKKIVKNTPNYCENCGAEFVRYPFNKYAVNPAESEDFE